MSARDVQDPTVTTYKEDTPGHYAERTEEHPAYAQIAASRVSSSGGVRLYGSDFLHQNFVTISIHRSQMHRSLSHDWPHPREEYIEVALSEAQWAAFVSSMNVGSGVQCTLYHLQGKQIPGLPRPPSRTQQSADEMLKHLEEAKTELQKLSAMVESGKGGKQAMRTAILKATHNVDSNLRYVAEQFDKHMEETVEKARIEVNAYAQTTLTRLGLAAAPHAPATPLALDEGTKGEQS